MSTDPKIITVELQAISGGVKLADAAIKKVQTQTPPGPPNDPTQITLLQGIADAAAEINAIANSLMKDGGTGQ